MFLLSLGFHNLFSFTSSFHGLIFFSQLLFFYLFSHRSGVLAIVLLTMVSQLPTFIEPQSCCLEFSFPHCAKTVKILFQQILPSANLTLIPFCLGLNHGYSQLPGSSFQHLYPLQIPTHPKILATVPFVCRP